MSEYNTPVCTANTHIDIPNYKVESLNDSPRSSGSIPWGFQGINTSSVWDFPAKKKRNSDRLPAGRFASMLSESWTPFLGILRSLAGWSRVTCKLMLDLDPSSLHNLEFGPL